MFRNKSVIHFLLLVSSMAAAEDGMVKTGQFEQCRAKALALHPGRIVKVEMKIEANDQLYEFDIRDQDNRDWDIECNAMTAEIVEVEEEIYGINDPRFSEQMKVDYTRAKSIALQAYPGKIVEMEYEIEDSGLAVYEFDIKQANGDEIKLEINARTGEIMEVDLELWQIGYE